MSRADDLRAKHEAELAVIELEDELAAAKDSDNGASRELKDRLREARRVFRELRAGEAVAAPAAITVSAEVSEA
jgi:hypothetical protein